MNHKRQKRLDKKKRKAKVRKVRKRGEYTGPLSESQKKLAEKIASDILLELAPLRSALVPDALYSSQENDLPEDGDLA